MKDKFDIIVLGAGMAGCGVASYLASHARVILLEKETFAGTHSTGRSAALFSETYGSEPIRALSRASKSFLASPPPEFGLASPLRLRGNLYVATAEQEERLVAFADSPLMRAASQRIDRDETLRRCPILREDYVASALWEKDAQDIDVDALLQAYLRHFRQSGGIFAPGEEVTSIERSQNHWVVATGHREIHADVVVNAAGAWADRVARLAGLTELGISPMQRTAVLVSAPADHQPSLWPCVIDIDEQFYFKPDGGQVLISPADETPVEPCDAQPDELDIAIAIDRVERATRLAVRSIPHKWAGLRSFAPDRLPVVGYEARAAGFFWLAGQGGYGIQTAPALSEAAASSILERPLPASLRDNGIEMGTFSPSRLMPRPASSGLSAASR